jgi:hypothetical protein
MHIEYGIRRAEVWKTQPEKQILLEISILPNLCKDIDFGKVSRKRPELRQHHEYGDTTLRVYTTNWIMRNKMLKTLQESQKLLEISILPNFPAPKLGRLMRPYVRVAMSFGPAFKTI